MNVTIFISPCWATTIQAGTRLCEVLEIQEPQQLLEVFTHQLSDSELRHQLAWNPMKSLLLMAKSHNVYIYIYIYILYIMYPLYPPLIDYIFSVFGGKIHPRWLNFPLKLSFYSGISSVSRDPRHPLWSGGAADRRQRLQPRGTGGTGSAGADGSWSMPFTNSINLKDG